ncbi:phospholipid phosphatase [Bacillus sp. FJAT-18019]|nr:phospholipid phosphatase [Bacillus sp. FJAT-18019]
MNRQKIRWISGRQQEIFYISVISLLGFLILTVLVKQHSLSFDLAIISSVQSFEHPLLTDIAKGLSFIGSFGPVLILCLILIAVLYWILGHRMEIFLLIGVVFGSSMLNLLLKGVLQRVRPDINRLVEITGYSYPSGHSMAAFSFYSVSAYLLWRHMNSKMGRSILIAVAIIMILSIGISRIYLGVHYPSDVLGGYLASCAWFGFLVCYYERRMGATDESDEMNDL